MKIDKLPSRLQNFKPAFACLICSCLLLSGHGINSPKMRTRKMAKINGFIMALLTFFICYFLKLPVEEKKLSYEKRSPKDFNLTLTLTTKDFLKLPVEKKKLSFEKPSPKDFNLTLTLITKDEVIKRDGIQHKEWCQRCVNYHQYKALIYPDESSDTYLDMVMFTQTYYTENFFQRRRFFRKYMLNHTNFPTLTVKHMFVFGECFNDDIYSI